MRSVHFNVIQCCKIVEVSFKMASCRGATFRKNLPQLTCSPETVFENPENEIPMDVTEEISGNTDSVSSDEPVLSQSTAKLSLPVKLTAKILPLLNPARARLYQVGNVQHGSLQ